MCKSSSSLTVFRMINTGLKSDIFLVTKCKGQACIAVKMANSFKEKLPESMGLSHATDLQRDKGGNSG